MWKKNNDEDFNEKIVPKLHVSNQCSSEALVTLLMDSKVYSILTSKVSKSVLDNSIKK